MTACTVTAACNPCTQGRMHMKYNYGLKIMLLNSDSRCEIQYKDVSKNSAKMICAFVVVVVIPLRVSHVATIQSAP